jgi:hypothetical protein
MHVHTIITMGNKLRNLELFLKRRKNRISDYWIMKDWNIHQHACIVACIPIRFICFLPFVLHIHHQFKYLSLISAGCYSYIWAFSQFLTRTKEEYGDLPRCKNYWKGQISNFSKNNSRIETPQTHCTLPSNFFVACKWFKSQKSCDEVIDIVPSIS